MGVIAIAISIPYMTKPQEPQNNDQNITNESISSSMSTTLPENYTSIQLLNYCSQNESLIYNDVCIRGLWDVTDECKNGNFSSTSSVCNDSRLGQFEDKVNKEMQDLDNSLTRFVNSCMNVTSNDDIENCSANIDRIKNDCTDPRFASMMTVCADSKFDQFDEKYKNVLTKLNSTG